MKILDLCEEERPREKLLAGGPKALSNAELIALVLRTGFGSDNALDLGQRIMKAADGSLVKLSEMSVQRLCDIYGVGTGKAAGVLAALELGRRCCSETPTLEKISLTGPEMVYRMMGPLLKGLSHEELWALLLNNANYVTAKIKLCSGGLSAVSMDSRNLLMKALDNKATAVILIHNHPSGSPHPGKEDIACTDTVRKALKNFDIALLDHIIICDDCYYSFSDGLAKTVVQ